MARKGDVQWQLGRIEETTDKDISWDVRYALRADGVLVKKQILISPAGRHDYGWKIHSRKPKANAREILERNGYVARTGRR